MATSTIRMRGFETYATAKDVSLYLKNVLSRPSSTKEETYLYRYTKIDRLVKMLKNRYMRLGPCADMNDKFEMAVLERHGLSKKLFYACFTKADESLAMYKLYGIDQDSVIFRISYTDLEQFLIENIDSDTGERFEPNHNFNIWFNNKPTNRFIQGKLFCTAVGYVDPATSEIKTGTKTNNNITGPFNQLELAGKVKYKCWEYEDEVRLCGELSRDLADKECIAVKIPDRFDSMITVTLCPGFDTVKNNVHLMELRMRGINYTQSVYDPIYSEFISSIPGVKVWDGSYQITPSHVEGETLHLGV